MKAGMNPKQNKLGMIDGLQVGKYSCISQPLRLCSIAGNG